MADIVLEYLQVILTAPVIFGALALVFFFKFGEDIKALFLRIAKIKLGSGVEVSTPQSNRLAEEDEKNPPEVPDSAIQGLPLGLTPEQHLAIEQIIRSHISNTYLWEYRYLNYFLVRSTQVVLDWLAGFSHPITYAQYDSFWLPLIPSAVERQNVINALQAHHLVIYEPQMNMISITPKGQEYREWRGELPELPAPSE